MNSSLIDNFIRSVTQKRMNMEVSLTRVRDKLRHVKYTMEFHHKILKLDIYTYNNHLGLKDAEFHYEEVPKGFDYGQLLGYRFSIPYLTEKLIITLDNKSLKAKNPRVSLIDFLNRAYLGAGQIKPTGDKSIFVKLFFYFGYDQMKLQQYTSMSQSLVRIVELYKPYPEVDIFLIDNIGLTLEKLCVMNWILYGYIMKFGKTYVEFSIEDFYAYILRSCNTIEEQDIDNFLKFTLIDFIGFKNEYFNLRKNLDTDELLEDSKLKEFDQFLPKISFWYPLIAMTNSKMFLVSYTALVQFMQLERLYDYIYKCSIPNFKSVIHGHAFNRYVKEYIDKRTVAKVYGDSEYKVGVWSGNLNSDI